MVTATIDTERWAAAEAAADAELAYWGAHRDELLERYPDRFVAVHNGEIVGTAADLVPLLDELRSRDIDPARAWVRFIPASERHYLR